jgi:hypothetical protein
VPSGPAPSHVPNDVVFSLAFDEQASICQPVGGGLDLVHIGDPVWTEQEIAARTR